MTQMPRKAASEDSQEECSMSKCRCWDQCCCEQEELEILELIAAVRAVLSAAQPFTSAWEFDSFDMSVDGEEMAKRLRVAVERVEDGR